MTHIFRRIGWDAQQLEGGYKAFRAHINTALEVAPALRFKVVCGTTGSGKSRLLEVLHAQGAQVLDLEQLAEEGEEQGDTFAVIPRFFYFIINPFSISRI